MANLSEPEFIKEFLTDVPPDGCPFKVGDIVTFTNDYGVEFPGKMVIGFSEHYISEDSTKCVHLSKDAYWFPCDVSSLTLDKQ